MCFCMSLSKIFENTGSTLAGLYFSLGSGSFLSWMGVMPANGRVEGNFPLLKDLLTGNFKMSAEHCYQMF